MERISSVGEARENFVEVAKDQATAADSQAAIGDRLVLVARVTKDAEKELRYLISKA